MVIRSISQVAQLVPLRDPAKRRVPGSMKGGIWIAPDFDVLPDEIGKAFGMEEPRGGSAGSPAPDTDGSLP